MKTKNKNQEMIIESILYGSIKFLVPFGLFILLSTFLLKTDIFSYIYNLTKGLEIEPASWGYCVLPLVLPCFILALIFIWLSYIFREYEWRKLK
jgi:hypothetical protein